MAGIDVEYTQDNVMACWCAKCPVQEKSMCSAGKWETAMGQMSPDDDPPAADDVPREYCSHGTASCSDLDFSQQCQCLRGCPVYASHGLSHWKYCQEGSAQTLG